jgi:hypothetical protein
VRECCGGEGREREGEIETKREANIVKMGGKKERQKRKPSVKVIRAK